MPKATQYIQRFNRARDEIRELLPRVDLLMEIYPGWTIKEVLAHLAGWDDATNMALEAFLASNPQPVPASRGIDPYNAQTVAERSDLDYTQIVGEWELAREQLIPLLERLTDENLAATIVSPWGPSITIINLIDIMIEHEEEHAEVIKKRLANPQQPPAAH